MLREIIDGGKNEEGKEGDDGDDNNKELRIGIKDWYVNSLQLAIILNYINQVFYFLFYLI